MKKELKSSQAEKEREEFEGKNILKRKLNFQREDIKGEFDLEARNKRLFSIIRRDRKKIENTMKIKKKIFDLEV